MAQPNWPVCAGSLLSRTGTWTTAATTASESPTAATPASTPTPNAEPGVHVEFLALSTNAPVAVISSGNWMLDIKVDVIAERARIAKEITRIDGEIAKSEAKLANASFVDRAPASVVEQEQKRLADFKAKLVELRVQFDRLK